MGSAVIQAARQVGGTIGVAILGSLLISAYRSHLDLTGLPAAAAAGVRSSLFGGVAVAHQLGSAQLFDSVRRAFVHGMDVMLLVCAGLAVAGMVLALVFLPRRSRSLEARRRRESRIGAWTRRRQVRPRARACASARRPRRGRPSSGTRCGSSASRDMPPPRWSR